MTLVQRAGDTLTVRKDVMMWHTVLRVDFDNEVVGVHITNNPLEFSGLKAQVVMHKTRSHNCAVQVARYVRRRFGVHEAVQTHRSNRAIEAKIGYACTTTHQYEPNERTPGWGVFQHIAATPIKDLLAEVKDGDNAARTRYVVYEVRSKGRAPMRGITHRFHALETRYRQTPPDTLVAPDVVVVKTCASMDDARRYLAGFDEAGDHLWTRFPPDAYLRRVLRVEGESVVHVVDGTDAVRRYASTGPVVCLGPQVYTLTQILRYFELGRWVDGRTHEGRRI